MADIVNQILGLGNQTNQNQWWQGSSQSPTSGYGTYQEPTLAAPSTEPAAPTATEPASPAMSTESATPSLQKWATEPSAVTKAKMNIQRMQQQMYEYQQQLIQYQGTDYGDKISKYIQQLQLDLQREQQIIASNGAGYS